MRSSNGFWNLMLLVLGLFLAGVVRLSFRGTSSFLAQIAPAEQVADSAEPTFGVSSVEGELLRYVDDDGNIDEYDTQQEIESFCIGYLNR